MCVCVWLSVVCACVQTQRAPVGVVSGAVVCVARLEDTEEEDEEEIERNSADGSMCARVLLHVSVRTRLRLYAHACVHRELPGGSVAAW